MGRRYVECIDTRDWESSLENFPCVHSWVSSSGPCWVVDSVELWPALVKLFLVTFIERQSQISSNVCKHQRLWRLLWFSPTHLLAVTTQIVIILSFSAILWDIYTSDTHTRICTLQTLRYCILCHVLLMASYFMWNSYILPCPVCAHLGK